MRISSRTFLDTPVADMTTLQANVDRTQREVATGIRADAALPGNAVRLDALDAANIRLARYAANAAGVRDRLNSCESVASDAADVVQRARELALQAANGSLDAASRTTIAIELRGLREQLLAVGNRTDSRGEYLLAGSRSWAPPFVDRTGTVQYDGDTTLRSIDVLPGRAVIDSLHGAQWAEVVTATGSVDVFAVLDGLATSLDSVAAGALDERDFQRSIAASIDSLSAGVDHFATLRATIGSRIAALDVCDTTRDDLKLAVTQQTSALRDVDLAAAISRLQGQLAGLQAARQSYAQLSKLGLFEYL